MTAYVTSPMTLYAKWDESASSTSTPTPSVSAVITDLVLDSSGVPTAASGAGWTYSNGKLTIKENYILQNITTGVCLINYGTVTGGRYNGLMYNYG